MHRNHTLDQIRGLAFVTITLNHFSVLAVALGFNGVMVPTLTHAGYSSSAELFFIVSGYLAGAVYLVRKRDVSLRRLTILFSKRAGVLYICNGILFLGFLGFMNFVPPEFAAATDFSFFIGEWDRVAKFFMFGGHPFLFGILPVYVGFVLALPAFLALAKMSLPSALALTIAVYLVPQIVPLNLPGGSPDGPGTWNLNPIAWQILFFGGVVAGGFGALDRVAAWVQSKRLLGVLLVGALAAFTIAYVVDTLTPMQMPQSGKRDVEIVRVVHSILIVTLLYLALPLISRRLPRVAMELQRIGAGGIGTFLVSIVLSYMAGLIWLIIGGAAAYYALACTAVALLGVYAAWTAKAPTTGVREATQVAS